MDEFVSSYTKRLDGKGRVSIPASFREILGRDGFEGLYCCSTLDGAAIDAGGLRLREMIRATLARFDPFSPEYQDFSSHLNGQSDVLTMDKEGRVILSQAMKARAGIGDRVTFVGQGYKFQIWDPERFSAYLEESRPRVRDMQRRLGASPPRPRSEPEERG